MAVIKSDSVKTSVLNTQIMKEFIGPLESLEIKVPSSLLRFLQKRAEIDLKITKEELVSNVLMQYAYMWINETALNRESFEKIKRKILKNRDVKPEEKKIIKKEETVIDDYTKRKLERLGPAVFMSKEQLNLMIKSINELKGVYPPEDVLEMIHDNLVLEKDLMEKVDDLLTLVTNQNKL